MAKARNRIDNNSFIINLKYFTHFLYIKYKNLKLKYNSNNKLLLLNKYFSIIHFSISFSYIFRKGKYF